MNNKKYKGLSSLEVEYNRKKYGSNKLINKKKNSFFKLLLESLSDPIIRILLIALGIKVLFLFNDSNIYETLGIVVAIFFASFISAISEYGSEKAFEKLSKENSIIEVKTIRNNKKQIVLMDDIVVKDIIFLQSGDKVPADGKILEGELYVDESFLTGETEEKHKNIYDNEIYMGSAVTEKSAIVEITKVGSQTYYGKIANEIQNKTVDSPLKIRLKDLASSISKFGYISAILVFISYLLNIFLINPDINNVFTMKYVISQVLYALTLSVAVIVMAVPEGLPMMITLVLSSNMKRLVKRNVLVRKLVGIETSGSMNILFTDKTGTLTEGKLKVERFVDLNLNEYKNQKDLNLKFDTLLYNSLILNSNSYFNDNKIEGGNTTEKALLNFYGNKNKYNFNIISKQDFDSKLKYSSAKTDYQGTTTFFKGAYEIILDKSIKYINSNGDIKYLLDKTRVEKYIIDKTSQGERVLALAMSKDNNLNNLILIGFIFLKDNIRKESFEAVKLIKQAQIQLVMVTGDAKETAISIAKDLKIIENKDDIILSSEEFNNMSDDEIIKILPKLKVLNRSLPSDKNRLVYLAQKSGLIVGMTGDGVNDAPAIKRADVGFSMGSGTEIAKETSDIVILDDNIMSIVTSIVYGRTIFKSIRKFVVFQLTINICAVLLSIVGPCLGILSPVTVIQMLWINMVMDTLAGLAFAFEPALIEYMQEKPKNKKEKILNKYMKNQILFDSLYASVICIWFLKSKFIYSLYRYDPTNKYLMTAFFGLFIFIAIFNAFNARTYRINVFSNILKNKVFIFILSFIAIVQIILIYYGGEIFRTTGLTIYEFEIMIFIAFTILPFDFIRKILLKRKKALRHV